ncbi:MAG: hypothetical protein WC496_00610 [Phycisphaerae bacterium]|jgi:hypothetical protein
MKNKHSELSAIFILIILTSAFVFAKDIPTDSNIPAPPEAVNAYLPKNKPIPFDLAPKDGQADIEFLVYVADMQEYATATEGDWEKSWYLIKCGIIKNTVGRWNNKELNFICYDTYPAPESKIMLKKTPFPYLKGRVFNFQLEDSNNLPVIIGQEQRSPVSPYEKLNRLHPDSKDPNQNERYDKIIKAASEIIKGGMSIIYEGEKYYIVENTTWRNYLGKVSYVMVDKTTFKAAIVPSFDSAGQNKEEKTKARNCPYPNPTEPPTDTRFADLAPEQLIPHVLDRSTPDGPDGCRLACAWFIWKTMDLPDKQKLRNELADRLVEEIRKIKKDPMKMVHDVYFWAEMLGPLGAREQTITLLKELKYADCGYGPNLAYSLAVCGNLQDVPVLIDVIDKESEGGAGAINKALEKLTGVKMPLTRTYRTDKAAWQNWWNNYKNKKL